MPLRFKNAEERKPVLGAYAAMARNNAYIILSDIMERLHIEQPSLPDTAHPGQCLDKEAHLDKLSLFPQNNDLMPETKDKAMKLLCSHFPFLQTEGDLRIMNAPDGREQEKIPITYEEKCRTLLDALAVLTYLRDANLHYLFNDRRAEHLEYRLPESKACHLLRLVLKAAPRKISERYKGTGLMPDGALDFFIKKQYVREGRSFKFNMNWLFSPQREPEKREMDVYRKVELAGGVERVLVANPDGTPARFNRLSLFGEVLLISLFTEKRYIPNFLKACGLLTDNGFTETTIDGTLSQQRLIREIVAAYSIRLPKRHLDITMDADQVMLDIFNELAKCPDELYTVLPEAKKRELEAVNIDGETVIKKRHSDRFVPLLLRFIDTNDLFPSIRFQVNSGYLRFLHHEKAAYMDGVERPRILQDAVNGFGRIQEVERTRSASDTYLGFPLYAPSPDDDAPMSLPCITDSASRYIVNGECIGLSISGDRTPVIIQDGGKYRVRSPQPDCWISRYELPAMGFYLYLSQKYDLPVSAEKIIIDKVNEYRSFFQGVANGTITSLKGITLAEKDIPGKLLDYLNGKTDSSDFNRYKKNLILSLLEKTENRLKRFLEDMAMVGSKENRIGKRSFVRVLPGKLASYLADDIVFFQSYPAGHPEKRLTGQQFSILQGLLATFPPDIEDSCRRAGLLSGETAHPFLKAVFDSIPAKDRNTLIFYEIYLKRKIAFLKGPIPDSAPFLHPGKVKWQKKDAAYYKALAQRYLDGGKDGSNTGILLPRGLFDQAITDVLTKRCPGWSRAIQNTDHANTAFKIITYLLDGQADDYQWFYYEEDRLQEYRFSQLIISPNAVRNGWKDLKAILQEEGVKLKGNYYKELEGRISALRRIPPERLARNTMKREELRQALRSSYDRMCENEKSIRRIIVQDIVLFLLARWRLDPREKLNMSMIGQDESKLMNQVVTVDTLYKGQYRIRQNDVRIKDQGVLFKTLNDKRIDSLLDQLTVGEGEVINLEDLIAELTRYDDRRIPVVAKIMEYEKRVLKNHPELRDRRGRMDFKSVQRADEASSPQKKVVLRTVRNAFSHNAYPDRVVKAEGEEGIEIYNPIIPGMADGISGTTNKLVDE